MIRKYSDIVLVDIDGTLTKVGDRLKHLNETPCNWDDFYERCDEDDPIQDIVDLVIGLSHMYDIVFCTGRRESVREKTIEWLRYCLPIIVSNDNLLMRKDDDHRHDTEIKPELLREAGIELDEVSLVLEDRNSMVKKWRDLGLTCLQVADGDF